MERIGQQLIDNIGQESLIKIIVTNYSSPETQSHYREIVQKLGPEFIRGFGIYDVASEIIKRDGLTKIKVVYEELINQTHNHLEFIPEHTEKKLGDPIMQDFYHQSPGEYGYETEEVKITEHWTVDDVGQKEISEYLEKLKEKYEPRKKEIIFKKLFSKKP
jgi:hypothetical protein